jgi:hypothetical protein
MHNIRKLTSYPAKISYFNDQVTPLANLARVIRAPLFKNEPGRRGQGFHIISIKDFPPAGYLPTPQREIILQDSAEKARGYIVEPYDLLVTIVGTIGAVTIVPEYSGRWIPATNMLVLRFREPDPRKSRGLYALLKSPQGQGILKRLSHGQGIQIVSKKQFSGVLIPEMNGELLNRTEELWQSEQENYEESRRLFQRAMETYETLEDDAALSQPLDYPARETIS